MTREDSETLFFTFVCVYEKQVSFYYCCMFVLHCDEWFEIHVRSCELVLFVELRD